MAGNNALVVTVSQLNRRVAFLIKDDKSLANLSVKGEISNFSVKDGHFYFSLTEKTVTGETVSVKAVMFSSSAGKLGFLPENGMSVIVVGSVQCYERYGIYQIYVSDIIPGGEGARSVALKQLSDRLRAEGIFSRKRRLPEYPRRVCVITSETGAVLHDICENIDPLVKLVLIPAAVQGEKAPESLCRAFELANSTDAELIIFGRGGGSAEELSAFNDERVVRAVFGSRIPTISAVGHETDHSLTDYAADASASTPTAAAKLAAPDRETVLKLVTDNFSSVSRSMAALLKRREQAVEQVFAGVRAKSPVQRLSAYERLFDDSFAQIQAKIRRLASLREKQLSDELGKISGGVKRLTAQKEKELFYLAGLVAEKDPMKLLTKGYSVVYKDERPVSRISQLSRGDKVEIRLCGGTASAEITGISAKGEV